MKIKAAVLDESRKQLDIENIEVDGVLQPNEVMVKVLTTGLNFIGL
jgi:Zn-dependent alcohol dehydrogenase